MLSQLASLVIFLWHSQSLASSPLAVPSSGEAAPSKVPPTTGCLLPFGHLTVSLWLFFVHENTASKSVPSTYGRIRLVTPGAEKAMASPRPPFTILIPLGVPSGSTLPLQEMRRYSRTILVSHLSADDPL